MKIIYNNIIPFNGYKAINICGILFVKNGAKMSDVDINHEKIHTDQMKYMLWIFFYLWYVIEWFLKLFIYWNSHTAYRNISFEREAYANEDNLDYLKTRKLYAWWKYIIN